MDGIEPGGTGHNGIDHGGSRMSSGGEMVVPTVAEAHPLDHHLEEVLEALSRLSVAGADPGLEAFR